MPAWQGLRCGTVCLREKLQSKHHRFVIKTNPNRGLVLALTTPQTRWQKWTFLDKTALSALCGGNADRLVARQVFVRKHGLLHILKRCEAESAAHVAQFPEMEVDRRRHRCRCFRCPTSYSISLNWPATNSKDFCACAYYRPHSGRARRLFGCSPSGSVLRYSCPAAERAITTATR